jgi:hypothetical protein
MFQTFDQLPADQAMEATSITASSQAPREKSAILMMTICSLGFSLLGTVLSIALLISFANAKKEMMHAYVVDSTGNRLPLHQITDPKEQAQHIQDFAVWFVNGVHSYQWYIDGEKGEKIPDPGLKVSGGKSIPSAIYVATLAMRPQLAVPYRKNIAEIISEKRISEKESSYFKAAVGGVSPPQRVGTDRWKVWVKGTQISRSESGNERLDERYVVLTIGRITPVSLSIAQRDYKDIAMAKAYAETSAAGLEVQAIEDLASKYSVQTDSKLTTKGATK